jgi:hypothetical protein
VVAFGKVVGATVPLVGIVELEPFELLLQPAKAKPATTPATMYRRAITGVRDTSSPLVVRGSSPHRATRIN